MDADNAESGWEKKESFRSVLAQIVVVGAILAMAVFFAYRRGMDRQMSTEAIERARALLRQDTLKDLQAAVETLQPALASSLRGGDAHAVAARVHAELAVIHGEPAAKTKATEHLAQARAAESELEEVASTEALLAVAEGRTAQAVTQLEPLIAKGVRRLDLEYVLARAHLAAGRGDRALEVLTRAAEIAAREPRIHSLRADLLLEDGNTKEAIASYRRALAGNAQHPAARLGLAIAQAKGSRDVSAVDAALAALRTDGLLSPALEQRADAAKTPASTTIAVETP